MSETQLPPEHPVSGAVWIPRACCDWCGHIALVVFLRIGNWAITRSAHAGSDHPPVEPYLGCPAVTWLGDDQYYGRKLGNFIGFSDQETEILKALENVTPDGLRAAFGPDGPPRRDGFIDIDTIRQMKEINR